MAGEFTVITVRKFPSTDLSRSGKMDTVVFYLVDKNRQARVTLPKDAPTEAEILSAIREAEKPIHPITGKSFPL